MPRNTPVQDKTPSVQAPPDVPPIAGQPQAPPFFGILLLAGLVIIGVGLKSTSNIVGPVFLVLTLVITVSPLRRIAPTCLESSLTSVRIASRWATMSRLRASSAIASDFVGYISSPVAAAMFAKHGFVVLSCANDCAGPR